MKRLDYLANTDLKLYQDDDMFKINSDTVRLGEFLNLTKNNYTILDIGTNNGALLLYAFNKKKAKFYYGVDINKEALELAKENMDINGIKDYEFFNKDIKELKLAPLDYIVVNPPYFDGDNVSYSEAKRKARFSEYMPLDVLIGSAKRLLKQEGTLFMVYPSFKLAQVIVELDKCKFGVKRLQFIYDENKENATAFLIEARKEMKHYSCIDKPLINKRGSSTN